MKFDNYKQLNNEPLVSVIICFFNEERFISEAIESVISQTYNNWELLLVDDGSTDESTQIAKKWVRDYHEKIRYFDHKDHKNRGLSASRNKGISHARGNFIAFLDADDVWFPDKLKQQLSIMQGHPKAGMVCGATEYWNSWDKTSEKDIIIPVGCEQDELVNPPHLLTTLYPLGKGAAPSMSGIIIKKSIVQKHGAFEEEFTGMYEDQAFLSKIYFHENVFISRICFDRYRQRAESMCNKAHKEGKYDNVRFWFLKWLKFYLKQQNLKYKTVNEALKNTIFPYQKPIIYLVLVKLPILIKRKLFQMRQIFQGVL